MYIQNDDVLLDKNDKFHDFYVKNATYAEIEPIDVCVDELRNINKKISNQIILGGQAYYYIVEKTPNTAKPGFSLRVFLCTPSFELKGEISDFEQQVASDIINLRYNCSDPEYNYIDNLSHEGQAKYILNAIYPQAYNSRLLSFHLLLEKLVKEHPSDILSGDEFEFRMEKGSKLQRQNLDHDKRDKNLDYDENYYLSLKAILRGIDYDLVAIESPFIDQSLSAHKRISWRRYLDQLEQIITLPAGEILNTQFPEIPEGLSANDIGWKHLYSNEK